MVMLFEERPPSSTIKVCTYHPRQGTVPKQLVEKKDCASHLDSLIKLFHIHASLNDTNIIN